MVAPVTQSPASQTNPHTHPPSRSPVSHDLKRDTASGNPSQALTPGEKLRLAPTSGDRLLAASSPGSRLQEAAGNPQPSANKAADVKAPTLTASTKVTGGETGDKTRAGLQQQLILESKLNAAKQGGEAYSRELSSAAKDIPGSSQVTDGSYRAAQNGQGRLRLKNNSNPLEIAKYSGTPDQAVTRIKQFNQQIEGKENDAKRWAGVALASGGKLGVREAAQAKAEAASLGFSRDEFINNVRLQSGKNQNGNLFQARANSADPNRTPVIFVNGVNTDVNRSRAQALELSERFGSPVNHVVNVSSKDKLVRAGIGVGTGGALREGQSVEQFDQRVQQHLTGNRQAANTTANAILDQLYDPKMRANKTPVKVVGYSQGASITSQALRDVDSYLSSKVGDTKSKDNLTPGEKTEMLKRIRFLGIGPGAAERHITQDYREGGQITQRPDLANVNYRIIADKNDQIANVVGVGKAKPDVWSAADAGRKLANNDFHSHLSYFKTYEAADPGSIYNPQVGGLLDSWFSGQAVRGLAVTEGK